jgi:hypothetical protein
MNQISLAEILFEQLIIYFEDCKRKGERRLSMVIGTDNGIIEFKRLIPELKISVIDPQLKKMFRLSKLILEQWNKEIYFLKNDGELRCILINDDYTVSRINKFDNIDDDEDFYKKAKRYSFDKLIDYVNDFNGYYADNFNLELPPQKKDENKNINKVTPSLNSLITHEKNIEIVNAIKSKYKNIRAKELKLLLMALQDLELLPSKRIGSKFHKCCKIEFDWNIGVYSSMNDYEFKNRVDGVELEKMKQYIKSIIDYNQQSSAN